MGVGYILVNGTKQELISFAHLPVNTMREIAGNSVSASVTAWYLLNNPATEFPSLAIALTIGRSMERNGILLAFRIGLRP